jgi:hypothetical protein
MSGSAAMIQFVSILGLLPQQVGLCDDVTPHADTAALGSADTKRDHTMISW